MANENRRRIGGNRESADMEEIRAAIRARWEEEGGAAGWLGPSAGDKTETVPGGCAAHFENGDVVWLAESRETAVANIKDRARWYAHKHGQLLDLLRDAVEAPAPERHNEALRLIDEKCKEDQFDVVLLGDFQYGKSTTLDTLCGGREMSPQGEGTTPTSAVPVSIQCLERGETEEWGEIRFKTKRTLAGEIHDTFAAEIDSAESAHPLKKYLAAGDGTYRSRFCDGFDLDNPAHLADARAALEAAWEQYRRDDESKFHFDTRQRQLMEVATLVVRFYGTPACRAMLGAKRCPLDETGGYVWFPGDWSQGAAKGFGYEVGFEDARFAFVESVILHLRSPFLEKLGCRVTDCPGLDASAYDKEITRRALLRADGVLFVHKCQKMIGASALGSLFEFVKETGRDDRTCLALNLWGISAHQALHDGMDRRGRRVPSVVTASIQQIKAEQYGFPVVWCHVLLAYLAAMGERKCRTGEPFGLSERAWLAEKAAYVSSWKDDGSEPDEKLWVAAVRETNASFRSPELQAVQALDAGAVETVRRASHFDELLMEVSKIVLREKAKSILVVNGSRKALEILREHERDLQLLEEEAAGSEQECAQRVREAQADLGGYECETREEIEKSFFVRSEDDTVDALAREFRKEVLSEEFFDGLVRQIATKAYKWNRSLKKSWDATGERQFCQEMGRDIAQRYANFGMGVFGRWRGTPHGHWRRFLEDIHELNATILKVAERHFAGKKIFADLPIPQLPDTVSPDALAERFAENSEVFDGIAEKLHEGFWKGLWNALKWLFGGWLLELLGLDKSDEEIIREYGEKIRPDLENAFSDSHVVELLEASVREPVFAELYRKAMEELKRSMGTYREKIEERCRELMEVHRASVEEKRELMERNRQVREERIAPIRMRIEAFEKTVESTRE